MQVKRCSELFEIFMVHCGGLKGTALVATLLALYIDSLFVLVNESRYRYHIANMVALFLFEYIQ